MNENLKLKILHIFFPNKCACCKKIINYDDSKKVGGLKLPYKVSGTDLVIENIGQYTGPFVEDGSDMPKANVMSLLVTNTSKNVVQYGEIKIKINGEDTAVFKVTNLP